ncbi:hypothetical protein EVAR_22389_1 [Eumeta japonica]|uniref:Uncharacterized protein n=1 Tax=Eumeta variegata TaxID=151549 RepID=A0A4C1VJH9_EUMVA|nr:hypothetical protein EVAR_22389_1 [Eumeta japonica]
MGNSFHNLHFCSDVTVQSTVKLICLVSASVESWYSREQGNSMLNKSEKVLVKDTRGRADERAAEAAAAGAPSYRLRVRFLLGCLRLGKSRSGAYYEGCNERTEVNKERAIAHLCRCRRREARGARGAHREASRAPPRAASRGRASARPAPGTPWRRSRLTPHRITDGAAAAAAATRAPPQRRIRTRNRPGPAPPARPSPAVGRSPFADCSRANLLSVAAMPAPTTGAAVVPQLLTAAQPRGPGVAATSGPRPRRRGRGPTSAYARTLFVPSGTRELQSFSPESKPRTVDGKCRKPKVDVAVVSGPLSAHLWNIHLGGRSRFSRIMERISTNLQNKCPESSQ